MAEAGIENVWDYPRPPRLEPAKNHLLVEHCGIVVAETRRGFRVLETSHPPVYYLPPEDVRPGVLQASARRGSFCEWKGVASYWTLDLRSEPDWKLCAPVADVAWSYERPTYPFAAIKGYLAFYASRVDLCAVDGEPVQAQPGDFYGGWITSRVRGPFKGAAGTGHW
jgi:uncharacterized protein (DUF427 family)